MLGIVADGRDGLGFVLDDGWGHALALVLAWPVDVPRNR
jgi:hypothetical protein